MAATSAALFSFPRPPSDVITRASPSASKTLNPTKSLPRQKPLKLRSWLKPLPLALNPASLHVAAALSPSVSAMVAATLSDAMELEDADAFRAVTSAEGRVSVVGFGSLLSEKSARYTFPNLTNFRVGRIRNFRRVFSHIAPIFMERGIANVATREMSSLSVEEAAGGESVIVTVFEMGAEEVPAFIEREQEFRFLAIVPENLDNTPMASKAVICSRYSDQEYREIRLKGDAAEYERRYGRWGVERIWTEDVLPCRAYLRHCVLAARNLGMEAYDNFLDQTFLADRRTTIRNYLEAHPDIMLEQPPPSLAERYGG